MGKKQDRALQTPSEANRDKHINYLEQAEKAAGIETKDSDEFKKRAYGAGKSIPVNKKN